MLENQLSRYGAIAKSLGMDVLPPGGKLFLVSDSDDTTVGQLNLANEFPVDKDGVVRVYSTIQAAVNAAAANRGDVVAVLPGYDNTLGRADTWSTAGVTVLGIGRGSMRPTCRYGASTDVVNLRANNIRVSGMRFLAAADSIALAVNADTGFNGIHLDNNVWDFDTATNDFRVMLRLGSKRSIVEDNRFLSEDTQGTGFGVKLLGGDPDYAIIRRNYFYGQFDTNGDTTNGAGAIAQDTYDTSDTNLSGIVIHDNVVVSTDTTAATLLRVSAGYYVRGVAYNNRFISYDSGSGDTAKFGQNIGAGKGLKMVHNRLVGDSGQEKLIGELSVVGA